MNDVNKPPFVILALNCDTEQADHAFLHDNMIFNYLSLKGVYEGESERSYLVKLDDTTTLPDLIDIAVRRNQESILVSRPDRSTYLYFPVNGNAREIGTFKEVSAKKAQTNDAGYTYNPATDKYYLAE